MKHYIQLGVKLLNFQRRIDIKFTFTGELLHSLPSSTFEGGVGGRA